MVASSGTQSETCRWSCPHSSMPPCAQSTWVGASLKVSSASSWFTSDAVRWLHTIQHLHLLCDFRYEHLSSSTRWLLVSWGETRFIIIRSEGRRRRDPVSRVTMKDFSINSTSEEHNHHHEWYERGKMIAPERLENMFYWKNSHTSKDLKVSIPEVDVSSSQHENYWVAEKWFHGH